MISTGSLFVRQQLRLCLTILALSSLGNLGIAQGVVNVGAGSQTCVGSSIRFLLQSNQSGSNPQATSWIVHGTNYTINSGGGQTNSITVTWHSAQSSVGVTAYYTAFGGNYSGVASQTISPASPTKTATVSLSSDKSEVCENEIITFHTSTNSESSYYQYFVDDSFFAGGNLPSYSTNSIRPGIHKIHVRMLSTECVTNPQSEAFSDPIFIKVNPPVGVPVTPEGADVHCAGSGTIDSYSTTAIGAKSFTWSLSPATAGNITTIELGTATVEWNQSFLDQTGTINVYANGCYGPSPVASKPVSVTQQMGQPSIPAGIIRRCQGGGSNTFKSSASNANAYSWRILPSSAGTLTYNTLEVNGNTLSEAIVEWNENYSGLVQLFVTATGCGQAAIEVFSEIEVIAPSTVPIPGQPSMPNGDVTSRCQGEGVSEFSTSASNADYYNWSLVPSNAASIDNSIGESVVITWAKEFSGVAKLAVSSSNCRATSEETILNIQVTGRVSQPSVPGGPSLIPTGTTQSYSSFAQNSERYEWSIVPSSAGTISDGHAVWDPNFVGNAKVIVRALGCNQSSWYNHLDVIVYDRSYIRETIVLISGQKEDALLMNLEHDHKDMTTTFYDGLGREAQVVQVSASPNRKDIVYPRIYNEFGREEIRYLPFVSNESNGLYKANSIGEIQGGYEQSLHHHFYTAEEPKIARDTRPFQVAVFDNSPLNRIVKQGSYGVAWQPDQINSYDSEDHSIKYSHETNADYEVLLWTYDKGKISATSGQTNTYYAKDQLYKIKTKNEDHHEAVEYRNTDGKIILEKIRVSLTEWAETYYIYDSYGNLVVVLPPEAVDSLTLDN